MYPSYEVITQQYHELAELVSGMRCIHEARPLQKDLFIEVNGIYLEEFIYRGGNDQDIDYFRIKQYKNLSNIYVWLDKGLGESISFELTTNKGDVFSPMLEYSDLTPQKLHLWTMIDQNRVA